jgi:hypothetical protein
MSSRPIDRKRDAARSGRIGTEGDVSAIREMIPLGDTMYFVKEHGIYALQLADQIDPGRTNAAIPDTQQCVLRIGSDNPVVARTLLTANTLFKEAVLGVEFPREKALRLTLSMLKDIVALTDMRVDLEAADASAREKFLSERHTPGSLVLPAIGNLEARCDAFAQKAGHIVNALEEIAKFFYPRELAKKWIDSLTALAAERYGTDSTFAVWMRNARPSLLFVNEMRNMIEHPKPDWHIEISDFRLTPSGNIDPPFINVVRPGEEPHKATITMLMKQVVDELVSATEVLIAFLCSVNARPFGGLSVGVVELPLEQREYEHQRFYYGVPWGDGIARFG